MKNNKVKSVKKKLLNCINSVSECSWLFSEIPTKDFTRNRKLPFSKVVSIILAMGGGSLSNELLDSFNCSIKTPSSSAFVQQRSKIDPSAFEYLFKLFVNSNSYKSNYKGYRLLAVDGSDIHIPNNHKDAESLQQSVNNAKSYNLLHLNAMYDICNRTYIDALIQKFHNSNEHSAFVDMVDRYDRTVPTVFIADRGYESYNNMAHVQEKNQFFLIRIKDSSSSGILKGMSLPYDDEYDININLSLTRKQTNETKELLKNKNEYKYISHNSKFDFLPQTSRKYVAMKPYLLHFRIVRFKITENTYEVVLTNLDKKNFPAEELKKLYAMRWGIETSFRELKYTIGLLHFHSKKVEFIIQEIFAKLIMYNYSELIVTNITIQNKERTYNYRVNFTVAAHNSKKYFMNNVSPPEVEALISRYITPIRPDRNNPRKLLIKTAVSFTYRIA